jgi:hypothetical protein
MPVVTGHSLLTLIHTRPHDSRFFTSVKFCPLPTQVLRVNIHGRCALTTSSLTCQICRATEDNLEELCYYLNYYYNLCR